MSTVFAGHAHAWTVMGDPHAGAHDLTPAAQRCAWQVPWTHRATSRGKHAPHWFEQVMSARSARCFGSSFFEIAPMSQEQSQMSPMLTSTQSSSVPHVRS